MPDSDLRPVTETKAEECERLHKECAALLARIATLEAEREVARAALLPFARALRRAEQYGTRAEQYVAALDWVRAEAAFGEVDAGALAQPVGGIVKNPVPPKPQGPDVRFWKEGGPFPPKPQEHMTDSKILKKWVYPGIAVLGLLTYVALAAMTAFEAGRVVGLRDGVRACLGVRP